MKIILGQFIIILGTIMIKPILCGMRSAYTVAYDFSSLVSYMYCTGTL